MKQFSGNSCAETAVSLALEDEKKIDDAKDFYNLVDKEITDDAKDFNLPSNGPRNGRRYRSFLQPGKGYVNAKYVTLQCKITSVLNLHFMSKL